MAANIARLVVLLIPALIQLLSLQFSPIDSFPKGEDGIVHLDVFGFHFLHGLTTDQVELKLVTILSGLWVFALVSQGVRWYVPATRYEEFRDSILDDLRKEWSQQAGQELRFNVMFARRPARMFFMWRRLEWAWGYGYEPPDGHHDENISFWSRQGVCGRAFSQEKPVFVDLRTENARGISRFWINRFIMSPWHWRRTKGLKAVISVPMFYKKNRKARWEPVGVINVDAITSRGADLLERNRDALMDYFLKVGIGLAKLRG